MGLTPAITGAAPLTEVARRFNRDISTLSRAVGALQRIASKAITQAPFLPLPLNLTKT